MNYLISSVVIAVVLSITPGIHSAKIEKPIESSTISFDSFTMKNILPQMPTLQLPLSDMETKFREYADVPATFLKPPPLPQLLNSASSINYYEIPSIPSDMLTPPPLLKQFWSPDAGESTAKNAKLYYELPKTITGEILPTNKFPKKFNKELHIKEKPFMFTPKEEIILDPIDEIEYNSKQKEIHKLFDTHNKKKNQDVIKFKKVLPSPSPSISNFNNNNNHQHELLNNNENDNNGGLVIINPPLSLSSNNNNITTIIHDHPLPQSAAQPSHSIDLDDSKSLIPSASASSSSFTLEQEKKDDSKEHEDDAADDDAFNDDDDDDDQHQSLEKDEEEIEDDEEESGDDNKKLNASAGPLKNIQGENSDGERTMFHMVGFDGPMSYKWGFDTGKGPNRQFRYEERDREGIVKGHFGYYDQGGKLRITNYKNHPVSGLQMEPVKENDDSS